MQRAARACGCMKGALAGVVLLCTALSVATAASGEHVFGNGFDPCCTLGGEVSGLAGDGLVLHLAADGIREDKPIAPGAESLPYTFAHTVAAGARYEVTITAQPADQRCALANATGVVGSMPIGNINASCDASLLWDHGRWDDGTWN